MEKDPASTRAVLGSGVVFYVILFSCLAVLLVVGGITVASRNRRTIAREKRAEETKAHAHRRQRNAARSQSRKDRRKRR
jgi:hypothetical protein